MNFIYESLIIIAIALVMIGFASLICFQGNHYYIKSKGIEKKPFPFSLRFLYDLELEKWHNLKINNLGDIGILRILFLFLCGGYGLFHSDG